MFDADRWIEIWVTITRNKTRSLLTCFGVFWGILMLVLLLGSGTGMKNGIYSGTDGFATKSVFFWPGRTSEPYKGFNKGRYWNFRNRDIDRLREEVEGIQDISPIIWGARSEKNIVYGHLSGTYSVKGMFPEYFNIESQKVIYGRLLNDIDERERRKVCLIGRRVNETLFNNANSCGKYIRVNGLYYQIVGVVEGRSEKINMGGRSEESVFLPFSTLQQTLNKGDRFDFLAISVQEDHSVQKLIDDYEQVIKAQNEISPTDPQAISSFNIAEQFATFEMLFTGIDILVWFVGMGTLLSGIIGVSNIMMVTVRERTREIGVRRALGAKPWNIISQVMSESLLLTAISGLLGLSLGVFILDMFDTALSSAPPSSEPSFLLNPGVDIGTAVSATIVLLVSGVLAGLIPAWRAMKIKAIDAIREE